MSKTRLRICFTKCGDLRWISHRDLARVWERLLRRAHLQLAFSQGFHPKPRISFPSALALGIEALEEIVELEIVGEFNLDEIAASIRREMPQGMELLEISSPASALGKAKVVAASYRIPIPPTERAAIAARLEQLRRLQVIEISRDDKVVTCDPHDPNFQLCLEDEFLLFTLPNTSAGSVRPSEMLECIGLPDLLADGALLQRTRVHLSEPVAGQASLDATT